MIEFTPETLQAISTFFQYGVPGIAAIWLFMCYSVITGTQNKIEKATTLPADKKTPYIRTQLILAGTFIAVSAALFVPSVFYIYFSPSSKIAIVVRPYHPEETPVYVSNERATLDDTGRGSIFLSNNALLEFENNTVGKQKNIIQQQSFEISNLKRDLVLEKAKDNTQFGGF
ncbi:hypothetical protein [Planctobacterium marinum]|uniref:Uncharacterized protein n=1 Tax=Planctobacterium marinum TaxID=1631968 RepID=A0AA48KU76_9ALTE|nr:hypothetical protein MACH26_16910 [Planctobacterium marinum]